MKKEENDSEYLAFGFWFVIVFVLVLVFSYLNSNATWLMP